MAKITDLQQQKKNPLRLSIFVDGEYWRGCTKRVAENLGLKVGMDIDKDEINEKIEYAWKDTYKDKWGIAEERQTVIKSLIESWGYTDIKVTGFGADTQEYIKSHPEEHGEPDLKVQVNDKLVFVECTGCPALKGEGLWIRKDKIEYALKHPEKDIWFGHRVDNANLIRFIKLEKDKDYEAQIVNTGFKELMVVFDEFAPEVNSDEKFKSYLDSLKS